jgi:1,2-phenylacetyl-CoA epoxidase PaaB subunit
LFFNWFRQIRTYTRFNASTPEEQERWQDEASEKHASMFGDTLTERVAKNFERRQKVADEWVVREAEILDAETA